MGEQESARRARKKLRAQATKQRERKALGLTLNAFAEEGDLELFAIGHTATLTQLAEA